MIGQAYPQMIEAQNSNYLWLFVAKVIQHYHSDQLF
jgi:hypothetical protein